jgi:hypothetical protein
MSRKPSSQNLYVGRAGQAVVMSEFLIRGYNVASPEADRGDDLFVVHDHTGANAKRRNYGLTAEFCARYDRLERGSQPDVTFVFVVRHQERWTHFFIIERRRLFELHTVEGAGTLRDKTVKFYLKFDLDSDRIHCNNCDFGQFQDDWSRWPAVVH